ncbi:MAG TPA: polysaccharide deacetylase family protein [Gaiellales bacterium]|nr:polysaccharide deacetylase family protein [Gaiellales bacterium]
MSVDVPDGFRRKAEWTIATLSATCAAPPDVSYPSPALPGSEAAWGLFGSGGDRLPGLGQGGLLDFGDGVEDVVASAFWFLSRWEERPGGPRDEHGRFPRVAALADPERPVVDALAARFRAAVGGSPRSGFTVALTHDVDNPWRWHGRRALVGAAARAKAAAAAGRGGELLAELRGLATSPVHRARGTDPNWSFERIAAIERAHGGRSTYYVMAGHTHPADGANGAAYDRLRPAIVSQVRGQGDEVGLHPSYATSRDVDLLGAEKARLEALTGEPVEGVRFHYLRHDAHATLPELDRLGFVHDSSHGFAETPGARAGLTTPYHPYDLVRDRPLDLVELPMVVMDVGLAERRYLGLPPAAGLVRAAAMLERVAESAGTVAVLWHVDRFDPAYARGWDRVYERLLGWVTDRGGRLVTAGDAVARPPAGDRADC